MDWKFEIISNECICGPSNVALFGSHFIECPKLQKLITPSRTAREQQLILNWQKAFFSANHS